MRIRSVHPVDSAAITALVDVDRHALATTTANNKLLGTAGIGEDHRGNRFLLWLHAREPISSRRGEEVVIGSGQPSSRSVKRVG